MQQLWYCVHCKSVLQSIICQESHQAVVEENLNAVAKDSFGVAVKRTVQLQNSI